MSNQRSNSGGVAARKGFKYQDHVAARFLIEMISNPLLLEVQCETEDDITLVWDSSCQHEIEYVQVKSNADEGAWCLDDIIERDSTRDGKAKKEGTSIAERSLLCDTVDKRCAFRLITLRDTNKYLSPLKLSYPDRFGNDNFDRVVKRFDNLYRSFRSPRDRSLSYWIRNTFWEWMADERIVRQDNLTAIFRLAEDRNTLLPTNLQKQIYRDILEMADDAATACRINKWEEKIIKNDFMTTWFAEQIEMAKDNAFSVANPYVDIEERFFVEVHHHNDENLRRSIIGLDAQFEFDFSAQSHLWRSRQLANYIVNFIPEMALAASDLVQCSHLTYRQNLSRSLRLLKDRGRLSTWEILSELLIHAAIRETAKSEPVACRIFHPNKDNLPCLRTAYFVHGKQTELWLGTSLLIARDLKNSIDQAVENISRLMSSDFLKSERDIIISLKEPRHLRPNTLDNALLRTATVDRLLEVLCLPILVAYDSECISNGFCQNYTRHLEEEIKNHFYSIEGCLSGKLSVLRFHLIFVPLESAMRLHQQFEEEINAQ
ncbi:DUF1837 domain-containing protein [Azospirillum brasilense]|nr:DUF1837 domain-containing protein [Azospirillum brasilense]